MKKAMLITVGTGKTVADGIVYAIRQQHPDFVLFLVTEESRTKTLPIVLEKVPCEHETRETPDPNDVEKIALTYSGYIEELRRKGYAPEGMVADFTSGTKAMSAGLVVAAVSRDVGTVSYVYGDRDPDTARVISGTERLMPVEPHQLLAEGQIRRAVDLFNRYQYDACLMFVNTVEAWTKKPDVMERVSLLRGLAEGYAAWDRFDHKASMTTLDKLTDHPLLPEWGLKKRLNGHKAFLHRTVKEEYGAHRAVDLFQNAARRAEEGKFDDATARLYRLLEYIAQAKLHADHKRLSTSCVDGTKLPERLRPKYEAMRNPRTGKIALGLVEAYELLCDIDDPVGEQFMREFAQKDSSAKIALGLRNASILAHGFGPVGQAGYDRCRTVVEKYLDLAFPKWRRLAEDAKFPKIRHRT